MINKCDESNFEKGLPQEKDIFISLTMEISMVPSQFLNVVLEEDNVSSSEEEENYDTSYTQKRW